MKHEITTYNTKKLLADSLKKAMKTKPFSKITVSEIISDCGVNRKTFYYHFEDIYGLLKWMFEEEAFSVVKKFDLLVDYKEAITFVMDYVEENDHILNCAQDSIGAEALINFFKADFLEISHMIIDEAERVSGTTLDAGYKEFLCNFYIGAVSSMLAEWVKNRDSRDRATITKYLSETLISSLTGILLKDEHLAVAKQLQANMQKGRE